MSEQEDFPERFHRDRREHGGASQRLTDSGGTPERGDEFAVPVGDLQSNDVCAVFATDHVPFVRQGTDEVVRGRDGQLAPSRDLLHGQSARSPTDRLQDAQRA